MARMIGRKFRLNQQRHIAGEQDTARDMPPSVTNCTYRARNLLLNTLSLALRRTKDAPVMSMNERGNVETGCRDVVVVPSSKLDAT